MSLHPFTTFSKPNRRLIYLLAGSHLIWCLVIFLLWLVSQSIRDHVALWNGLFITLQLFFAAQLLLPALLLHPETRSRGFYIFWGLFLAASIWLANQFPNWPTPAFRYSHRCRIGKIRPPFVGACADLLGDDIGRFCQLEPRADRGLFQADPRILSGSERPSAADRYDTCQACAP